MFGVARKTSRNKMLRETLRLLQLRKNLIAGIITFCFPAAVMQRWIPTVLRADLYAVAALVGAAVVVIANVLQLPSGPAALTGAALCFGLRVMAIWRGWQLPVAEAKRRSSEANDTTDKGGP